MRLVFCGTAEFAVPSLRALAAVHDVVAVVTQPDRPGSRGRPAPRPVAEVAAQLGVTVLRPQRVRAAESVAEIIAWRPDALVVAAYGQIIPAALLDGPPLGGINVHGSLLPRWRGAAPVAAAILAGDAASGVSIMRMDLGLDTGPVYAQREVALDGTETAPALGARLAALGAELLLEVMEAVATGTAVARPQDDALATVAPRLRREKGVLDWAACSAIEVDQHVRALQPWPGTTARLGDQSVRLLDGWVPAGVHTRAAPGVRVGRSGEAIDIATRDGVYRLALVQPPGGLPMSAAAYLRGRRHGQWPAAEVRDPGAA